MSYRQYNKIHNVFVIEKDKITGVDLEESCKFLEKKVPKHLMRGVDSIYIGNFPELIEKEINALYADGGIYVTDSHTDNMDFIEDIVHEVSHSLEQLYGQEIYADGEIEDEFVRKRSSLASFLSQDFQVPGDFLYSLDYDEEIDDFLYKKVGYSTLDNYSKYTFLSPYSVTSVREYWAIGFEEYILGDVLNLKNKCPQLFKKIHSIYEESNNGY